MQQQGVHFGNQSAQPQEVGTDDIDGGGRGQSMLEGPRLPADSQDHVLAQLDPRLPHHDSRLDLLVATSAFLDAPQHLIVPAFHSHVNARQTGLVQTAKVCRSFFMDIARRSVDGNPAQSGKQASGTDADGRQLLSRHCNAVAGRKEQRPDGVPKDPFRLFKILANLGHRSYSIARTAFVDHAETAFVVGTSHRRLDQQAVGLAGRSVDGTLVTHGATP